MAKPTAQQCHAMTTYFVSYYEEKEGSKPVVNRNKARWGFESILMDHSPTETKKIIEHYIDHYVSPSVEWLIFNYEKVIEAMSFFEKEQQQRAQRRIETAERLAAWEANFRRTEGD